MIVWGVVAVTPISTFALQVPEHTESTDVGYQQLQHSKIVSNADILQCTTTLPIQHTCSKIVSNADILQCTTTLPIQHTCSKIVISNADILQCTNADILQCTTTLPAQHSKIVSNADVLQLYLYPIMISTENHTVSTNKIMSCIKPRIHEPHDTR